LHRIADPVKNGKMFSYLMVDIHRANHFDKYNNYYRSRKKPRYEPVVPLLPVELHKPATNKLAPIRQNSNCTKRSYLQNIDFKILFSLREASG